MSLAPTVPCWCRGVSDYNHAPLVETGPGFWEDSPTFAFDDYDHETDTFAKQTFSTVVFNFLKSRCLAAGGAASCTLPAGINLGALSSSR